MEQKEKASEFWTRERCFITELLNEEQQREVSIARIRVEPGVTTELHSLNVAEWYVIESGRGRMFVGSDAPREVGRGDVVTIPKGTPQQIENSGKDDLIFLCVCAPQFTPASYTPLE